MTIDALHCRSIDFVTMPENNPTPAPDSAPESPESPETVATPATPAAAETPAAQPASPTAAEAEAPESAHGSAAGAEGPTPEPGPQDTTSGVAADEAAPDAPSATTRDPELGAATAATPEGEAEPAAPAIPAAPAAPAIADLSPAACATLLAERFPALFGAQPVLPIKLRIQADIQQRAPGVFSKKSLSIFLHRHTTTTAYIKALLGATHRFDLDGQPAGEIAQEHRDAAVAEVARRLAIVQARRAAERDALRQSQRQSPPRAAAAASGQAAAAQPAAERPPRTDRPAQPDRAPRPDRPPRPPRPDRPPRSEHTPRGETGPHAHGPTRPDRTPADKRAAPAPQRPARAQFDAPQQPPQPAAPLTPEQAALNEARRGRAALLRQYEGSTLTRANFCALKGLSEATLELQLEQARQERKLAPPPPPERAAVERATFDDRGPRRDPAGPRRPGRPQR